MHKKQNVVWSWSLCLNQQLWIPVDRLHLMYSTDTEQKEKKSNYITEHKRFIGINMVSFETAITRCDWMHTATTYLPCLTRHKCPFLCRYEPRFQISDPSLNSCRRTFKRHGNYFLCTMVWMASTFSPIRNNVNNWLQHSPIVFCIIHLVLLLVLFIVWHM